jgi:hypothetical protein
MRIAAVAELDFREVNILTWHSRQLTVANAGDIGCRVRVDVGECRHAGGGAAPQFEVVALPHDSASASASWLSSAAASTSAPVAASTLSVLTADDDDEADTAGGGIVLRLEAGRAATVVVRFRCDREGLCSAIVRMTPLLEGATAVLTRVRAEGMFICLSTCLL